MMSECTAITRAHESTPDLSPLSGPMRCAIMRTRTARRERYPHVMESVSGEKQWNDDPKRGGLPR